MTKAPSVPIDDDAKAIAGASVLRHLNGARLEPDPVSPLAADRAPSAGLGITLFSWSRFRWSRGPITSERQRGGTCVARGITHPKALA